MTVTKRKAKPITAHPMFPIVTSLWFAVFLSLGSFAIAPQVLEGPVVALGIPEVLPAAQPPLGFTVRALLALVMLAFGGLAGFVIGKALATGKADQPVRARAFGGMAGVAKAKAPEPVSEKKPRFEKASLHRPPLNPIEDLGGSLSGEIYAPVDPQALDGLDTHPTAVSEFYGEPATDFDVFRANAFQPDALQSASARLPWDKEDAEVTHLDLRPEPARLDDPLSLDLLLADAEIVAEAEAEAGIETDIETGAADDDRLPVATHDDACDDAAPAPFAAPEAVTMVEPPAPQAVPASVPLIKTPLFQALALGSTPLSRAPLEDLGLVQLTERLALAIGRRNARAENGHFAAQPGVQAAVSVGVSPVEAVESVDVAEALAEPSFRPDDNRQSFGFSVVQPQPAAAIARFGQAPVDSGSAPTEEHSDEEPANLAPQRVVQLRPTALRPFAPESEAFEEDAEEFDRFLRVRDPQLPTDTASELTEGYEQAFDDEDDGDEDADSDDEDIVWAPSGAEDDVAEERYPSLLDMTAGSLRHKAQFAQMAPTANAIEAAGETSEDYAAQAYEGDGVEPTVVFPGQDALPSSPFASPPRLFERPGSAGGMPEAIIPVPGSPLAAPGRAAPSSPLDALDDMQSVFQDSSAGPAINAEEADRALRAALATLQRMTAQG